MLMKLMEDGLHKRAMEVVKECEKDNEELYDEFMAAFERLKLQIPEAAESDLFNLESYFVQRMLVIEKSYIMGFEDGMNAFVQKFQGEKNI